MNVAAVRRAFETNFFGTLAVTQAMLPLLRRSASAMIVNQSSSIGSLTLQADPEWVHAKVKPIGYLVLGFPDGQALSYPITGSCSTPNP